MAVFVPFDKNVEVSGKALLSQIRAFENEMFSSTLGSYFSKYNVKISETDWFPQEIWLKILKEISEEIGTNTLFIIGRSIPDTAKFPPNINNLKKALASIDTAYHLNHRGGEIGYYKLVEFNENERTAFMECKNPYPDEFDRGIIMGILRKFAPEDSFEQIVETDTSKPTRTQGAESTWYKIKW